MTGSRLPPKCSHQVYIHSHVRKTMGYSILSNSSFQTGLSLRKSSRVAMLVLYTALLGFTWPCLGVRCSTCRPGQCRQRVPQSTDEAELELLRGIVAAYAHSRNGVLRVARRP